MIPAPTSDGGTGYVPHSGGAVFNTAIALGRLGISTGMLTGLSTDLFGVQLQKALKDSNVTSDLCIRSDLPTTLAFVNLKNGHASYTFYDENSAGRMLSAADVPKLPSGIDALFFGGISLAVEPCADAYADLLCKSASDHVIMLDPNIRPGFIRDEQSYRTRLQKLLAHSDIVKVSDEDLSWLFPDTDPLDQKASRLQSMGPALVIITRGARGATAYMKNQSVVSIPVPKVEVIDTVGAGDTFNAGVLAALADQGLLAKDAIMKIRKENLETALSYGTTAAATSVTRKGANPPWHQELATALKVM